MKEQQQPVSQSQDSCAYCQAEVDYLAVFPVGRGRTGIACRGCFVTHVESQQTDAQRFEALINAFGR